MAIQEILGTDRAGEVTLINANFTDLDTNKLTKPNGTAMQLITGDGGLMTPTATPASGGVKPFSDGGAFAELAKKADKSRVQYDIAWAGIMTTRILNMNAGYYGGTALVLYSGHQGGGDATVSKIFMVRYRHDGAANKDPSVNIVEVAKSGVAVATDFLIDAEGWLNIRSYNDAGNKLMVITNKN